MSFVFLAAFPRVQATDAGFVLHLGKCLFTNVVISSQVDCGNARRYSTIVSPMVLSGLKAVAALGLITTPP